MSAVGQGAGLLSMLLGSLSGRGSRALAGQQPLDWRRLPLPGLEGGALDPALFAGQVVLVVNSASRCLFTRQYRGLQALWQGRRAQGLVLLGVPANDFARQEPGEATAIRRFCDRRYGIDFPLLARQVVIGPAAHPLYRWAAAEGGRAAIPRWNFHKLLIGRDGRLAGAFSSAVSPASRRLRAAIDAALTDRRAQ